MGESQATTVSTGTTNGSYPDVGGGETSTHGSGDAAAAKASLLSSFARLPKIFVLPTHLQEDEVHDLEDSLASAGASVTQELHDAQLVLSAIRTPRRAKYELQIRGLSTAPVSEEVTASVPSKRGSSTEPKFVANKRRSKDLATPGPRTDGGSNHLGNADKREDDELESPENGPAVRVVRKEWLQESLASSRALDMSDYLVYAAATVATKQPVKAVSRLGQQQTQPILQRRQIAGSSQNPAGGRLGREGRRDRNADAVASKLAGRSFMPSSHHDPPHRRLLPETTSEHEGLDLPDMPDWVVQNKIYACERSAPANPPNEGFIAQLKKIRLARVLIGDEIGVRAYSTSIASLSAYPHELVQPREILALPGCNDKIAALFREYQEFGRLNAADEVDKDPVLSVIHDFYKIWGVGAATAREFYHDRGWRNHDDIIEYGWNSLSRHQQIGLKFFDDFELKMNRSEVEYIASVITYCAKQRIDDDVQCAIVGGYRRGNRELSDVDLIISHPDEEATRFLIDPLVKDLEDAGWITHTLTLAETTSNRDQDTLPLKSLQRTAGFDTLDKALVVWQDPNWTTKDADLERDPKAKNPNVHRRVDIIIAPWKVVGCAVMGWTSGTTFQRDLRRYCRKIKGWKFDSSGVRDLGTGRWVDLEGWRDLETRAKTWDEAEKKVFEGLGLPWRAPEERNTG